jgi:hypothetical protein
VTKLSVSLCVFSCAASGALEPAPLDSSARFGSVFVGLALGVAFGICLACSSTTAVHRFFMGRNIRSLIRILNGAQLVPDCHDRRWRYVSWDPRRISSLGGKDATGVCRSLWQPL